MHIFHITSARQKHQPLRWCVLAVGLFAVALAGAQAAESMPNACPVDGCEVKIVSAKKAGDEVELTFESNFTPDVSKNHFHVWWGENFTVKQVGRNAASVHGVTQGKWHRHDDYPTYITQGAASTKARGGAHTLCVSAADRDHNILDVKLFNCMDVEKYL